MIVHAKLDLSSKGRVTQLAGVWIDTVAYLTVFVVYLVFLWLGRHRRSRGQRRKGGHQKAVA